MWSINERLAGNIGLELPEPSTRQMDDLLELMRDELKQAQNGNPVFNIKDLL